MGILWSPEGSNYILQFLIIYVSDLEESNKRNKYRQLLVSCHFTDKLWNVRSFVYWIIKKITIISSATAIGYSFQTKILSKLDFPISFIQIWTDYGSVFLKKYFLVAKAFCRISYLTFCGCIDKSDWSDTYIFFILW